MMIKFIVMIGLLCLNLRAGIDFTSPPAISMKDSKWQIAFTVSASTDVEVAVLDANKKIVRHFAAGVLGGASPPPPPLGPGLSQTLVWDGKDDHGRPAANGPFQVRVRLGLTPKFERAISVKDFPGKHYGSALVPIGDHADLNHPFFIKIKTTGDRRPDLDITVNKKTELIYIRPYDNDDMANMYSFDGKTGTLLGEVSFGHFRQSKWGIPVFNWFGDLVYHQSAADSVYRFKPEGPPAPWSGTGTHKRGDLFQGFMHSRGLAAGPDKSLFVFHNSKFRGIDEGFVTQIGPDGHIAKNRFIWVDSPICGSIKADKHGNIYVGAFVKPSATQHLPDELLGKLPDGPDRASSLLWKAENTYGSILKFGPSGGKVFRQAGGELTVGRNQEAGTAQGLMKLYPWASPVISARMDMGGCQCYVSKFDVDRFDRVFMTDCFRYSIVIMDNNGNMIQRLHYRDIMLEGMTPVGWVHQLEVTDRALYGADYFNNEVISLFLDSEKSAIADLPLGIENGSLVKDGFEFHVQPNPFYRETLIRVNDRLKGFDNCKLLIKIYNIEGKLLWSLPKGIDSHASIKWNAANLPAGIYIANIKRGSVTLKKRLIHLK
jgi:hypothetical protein